MDNAMMFPATFDEFTEIFSFIDSKEYYTNGSELIQVFRVKQWLEHESNRQHNVKLTDEQLNAQEQEANLLNYIKAEAIKDFAERLDRKFAFYYSDTQCISVKTIRESIRNELKEMVGESK